MEANNNKNQKNSKFNLKKFKNNCLDVLDFLKELFAVIVMFIIVVIVVPIKFLWYFLPFNPIVFWVWTLIHPQSAARSLWSGTRWDEKERKAEKREDIDGFDRIMAIPEDFYWKLNKKCRWALPWRCRREFLEVTKLKGASRFDIFKFLGDANQVAIINAGWLDKALEDELFFQNRADVTDALVAKRKDLSTEEFRHLWSVRKWGAVNTYLRSHPTISTEKLMAWIDYLLKGNDEVAMARLADYVKVNGLPAKAVNHLHAVKEKSELLLTKVNSALDIYAQKEMIEATKEDTGLWRNYVIARKIKEGVIAEEVQHLMNKTQYKEFKERGWILCEKAIVFWFSKDDLSMAEEIIKAEGVKVFDTPNIKSLVAANPKLARLLLKKS